MAFAATNQSGDPMDPSNRETSFKNTGAVEQDRPGQKTNVAPLDQQLDHRNQDPLNKASDSGMPGKGQTPEFTGGKESKNQLDKDTGAELPDDSKKNPARFSNLEANGISGRQRLNGQDSRDETVGQDPGEQQN